MKQPAPPERRAQIEAELRREIAERSKGYREQALKILPHVGARCGREFDGRDLDKLTVHHKDHNFRNNPADGSNWELLCVYCHDNEHEKQSLAGFAMGTTGSSIERLRGFNSFEDLALLPEQIAKGNKQSDDIHSVKAKDRDEVK